MCGADNHNSKHPYNTCLRTTCSFEAFLPCIGSVYALRPWTTAKITFLIQYSLLIRYRAELERAVEQFRMIRTGRRGRSFGFTACHSALPSTDTNCYGPFRRDL